MPAVRIVEVRYAESFETDREALRPKYPEIDHLVEDLYESLFTNVPHVHLEGTAENVFTIRADYPPMGSLGRGRFLVTYHQAINQKQHETNPMSNALRVYTFLTITER